MLKTLKIKENTHKRLCEFGVKGESFDKLLQRLLDEHKELYHYYTTKDA